MNQVLIKGGIYRHYKFKYYNVINIVRDHRTNLKLVVYNSMYGKFDSWVRPYDMFTGQLMHQGKLINRFTHVSDINDDNIQKYGTLKTSLNKTKHNLESTKYLIHGTATHTETLEDYVIYEHFENQNNVFAITINDAFKYKICKFFENKK
jgi:hypothetical protein